MLEKKYKKLNWWEKLLFCCFNSTSNAMTTAHAVIPVLILVSLLFSALGMDTALIKKVSMTIFVLWVCVLVVALNVYDRMAKQS